VQARYAKAREVAILELREQLRQAGITTPVLEGDATPAMVEDLARRAGNLGQLDVLRSGKPFTAKNIREAKK
jgi:hypothetical protein